jgi:MFS family permease
MTKLAIIKTGIMRRLMEKPKRKGIRAAVEFLGLKKNMLALLAMVILVGLGERMAERFLPLYMIALGGGAISIGLLNGMDNLFSALYAFPGGYAADRLGYKKALILFNWVAMFGYMIVIIFPYWQAVLVGAIFFLSWSAISLPATMDMVSKVLPKNKRTMGVSMHSLVRRIPMALGPLLGGLLIGIYGDKTGIRLAFVIAFVLGLVSLVMQQLMIREDAVHKPKVTGNPVSVFRNLSPALRRLLVSDILIRFCEQIPYAFVVIWCVTLQGITPLQFGVLTTVEMVTAMLIYIPVAYLADKNTKKPYVVATFVFFTLFPLVLLFSRSFLMMVFAFILRGMKEFGEPTRKALIMDLAPEGKKASSFGVYYLVRDVIVSLAAFGGALLWDPKILSNFLSALGAGQGLLGWVSTSISPSTNFLVAFVFGVLGTIYFIAFGKDLRSEQEI